MAGMRARMQAARAGGAVDTPAPPTSYLAGNIILSLLAALVGGWVTARIAERAASGHLIALCVVIVVMGFVSARMPGSERQPAWYRFAIPLVGVVGVALSSLVVPIAGR